MILGAEEQSTLLDFIATQNKINNSSSQEQSLYDSVIYNNVTLTKPSLSDGPQKKKKKKYWRSM